jgi:hypothetical protein
VPAGEAFRPSPLVRPSRCETNACCACALAGNALSIAVWGGFAWWLVHGVHGECRWDRPFTDRRCFPLPSPLVADGRDELLEVGMADS